MYMAMPSGNVAISDKMQQLTSSGGAAGWYPDERDGFISWLRGEFAAANAIIDSMCHHLKCVGEAGEYDGVIGSIQQRRCNWSPVLHMQQYFSVADVLYALQQVTWRRQPPIRGGGYHDPVKIGKDYKRSGGFGSKQGHNKIEIAVKGGHNSIVESNSPHSEVSKSGEKDVTLSKYNDGLITKPQVDSNGKCLDSVSTLSDRSECQTKKADDECNANSNGCGNAHMENDSSSTYMPHQELHASATAKTFVGLETLDGKAVNVVDGMKMYEGLFDDSEVGKMVSLVNDLRNAGRQGQFQGQTFVVLKRPMKGHGREMIQLGTPIADAPSEEEVINGTSKDRSIEPIPSLFQDVIERLMAMKVSTVKPDSCIIDIFNEGDHSQPHMWPHWFGRPICVLFLTECEMTFGRVIGADHPGDYRGSTNLSLTPGSMLVMEGKSANVARHAIPSIRKQRMLVTFTKSQPKRSTHGDGPHSPSAPPSHWIPPPSRSPNHIRHPKHYVPVPPTTPSHPPPMSIFVPPPPPMAFPAPPIGGGWAAAPPPRLPGGTGVFLPPGSSGNSKPQHSVEEEKESGGQEDCNGSCDKNQNEDVKVAN